MLRPALTIALAAVLVGCGDGAQPADDGGSGGGGGDAGGEIVADLGMNLPSQIRATVDEVYFWQGPTTFDELYVVPATGGTPELIFTATVDVFPPVRFDAANVYFWEHTDGEPYEVTLYRCPLLGGCGAGPEVVLRSMSLSAISGFSTGGGRLFVYDRLEGILTCDVSGPLSAGGCDPRTIEGQPKLPIYMQGVAMDGGALVLTEGEPAEAGQERPLRLLACTLDDCGAEQVLALETVRPDTPSPLLAAGGRIFWRRDATLVSCDPAACPATVHIEAELAERIEDPQADGDSIYFSGAEDDQTGMAPIYRCSPGTCATPEAVGQAILGRFAVAAGVLYELTADDDSFVIRRRTL